MALTPYTLLLAEHSGRDKLIRTCSYTASLLSGLPQSRETSAKLVTLNGQLSACRVMLRLFDDVPALLKIYRYGWGSQEKDVLIRYSQVTSNFFDWLFLPSEHLAFLIRNGVLRGDAGRWKGYSIICWAISLTLSLIRELWTIIKLRSARINAANLSQELTDLAERNKRRIQLTELGQMEMRCWLTVLKNAADFVNAVNWLPFKVLWQGKLTQPKTGLFGVLSSVLGLFLYFQTKLADKK